MNNEFIKREAKLEKRNEIVEFLGAHFGVIYWTLYDNITEISGDASIGEFSKEAAISPTDLINRIEKFKPTLETLSSQIIFDMSLENDVLYKSIMTAIDLSKKPFVSEADLEFVACGIGISLYIFLSYKLGSKDDVNLGDLLS